MDKLENLTLDLRLAKERLQEVLNIKHDSIQQDAAIQRFEFTFELCWKVMQSIAAKNGMESFGPRNSIRNAAQLKLISDLEKWFEYLNYRNLSTHTYKQVTADKIYAELAGFLPLLDDFLQNL